MAYSGQLNTRYSGTSGQQPVLQSQEYQIQ